MTDEKVTEEEDVETKIEDVDTAFDDESDGQEEVEPDKAQEAEPGNDPKKPEDTGEEEPSPPEEPKSVPIAALHDERRKAQQAREELERLKALLPETDEAPDPYDDIDKYNEYMRKKWDKEQKETQDAAIRERIEKTRSEMLEQHNDYSTMEKVFELAAAEDQSLISKMLASDNPAKFAYEEGKKYREKYLGAKPEETKEPSPAEKRNNQALSGANLATATAQEKNTPTPEKELELDDVFDDQSY